MLQHPSGKALPPGMGGLQVGRAGRFGTKGLAITFVASEADSAVLNQVRPPVCSHLKERGTVPKPFSTYVFPPRWTTRSY